MLWKGLASRKMALEGLVFKSQVPKHEGLSNSWFWVHHRPLNICSKRIHDSHRNHVHIPLLIPGDARFMT